MHILSYPHPSVRVMNNLLAKPELDCISMNLDRIGATTVRIGAKAVARLFFKYFKDI